MHVVVPVHVVAQHGPLAARHLQVHQLLGVVNQLIVKGLTAIEGGQHACLVAIVAILEGYDHGLAVGLYMRTAIREGAIFVEAFFLAAFCQHTLLECCAAIVRVSVEQLALFDLVAGDRLDDVDEVHVLPFHLHPLGVGAEVAAHVVDVGHLHRRRLDDGLGLLPRLAGIGAPAVPQAVLACGIRLPVGPGHVYGLAGHLHVHGQLI